MIATATGAPREQRLTVRAVRIDSTVVEADMRDPTDIGLADDAARTVARETAAMAGEKARKSGTARAGSGHGCASGNRTLAARTAQGKATALS